MPNKFNKNPENRFSTFQVNSKEMGYFTEDYVLLNKKQHQVDKNFGTAVKHKVKDIKRFCESIGCFEILDYGCGKGLLKQMLGPSYEVHEFDPAIEGKQVIHKALYPIVVCSDVLEHVEPIMISKVLFHIQDLTRFGVYLTISTSPGTRKLPDGSLAHRCVHPAYWWLDMLSIHFPVEAGDVEYHTSKDELTFMWTKHKEETEQV